MNLAPMLEVKIKIAFLQSTVFPCESVRIPSSNTCSKMLKTSEVRPFQFRLKARLNKAVGEVFR